MPENTKILGNERNIAYLSEAFLKGKLSHAYIISGPEGSGKRTFASHISAALLCDSVNRGSSDFSRGPCGKCPSCAKAFSGNHPDIVWVRKDEKEKNLSVKLIRERIVDDVNIRPYYGPYKIYITEDAQLMSESAQNALLKTIEEPPGYAVIFLLTVNPDALLDTIKSRCVRLDMDSLPPGTVAEVLEESYGIDPGEAKSCAAYSHGCLGKALALARGADERDLIESVRDFLKEVGRADASLIYERSCELAKDGREEVIEIAKRWFRDILILKAGAAERLYFAGEEDFLRSAAKKMTYEQIGAVFRAAGAASERLAANVKAEAALENLFLEIRRNV